VTERGWGRRAPVAVGAGAALYLFTTASQVVPALPWLRADIMVSLACGLTLTALFVDGLLPLRGLGNRLLYVFAAALPAALLFSYLGWAPAANLAKVFLAVALGLWLVLQIPDVRIIVLIALIVPVVDAFSVFSSLGPTHTLLATQPQAINYFAVLFTWFGYSYREAYSAIGTSDLIFFSLYLGATLAFRLRPRLTLALMTVSFALTVALALWNLSALPALPLLSVGFLLGNADILWRRWRTPRP